MASMLTELFYDPLRYGYKFGQSIGPIGGHSDHVHIALANARQMVRAMRVAQNRFGLHVGENPFFDRVDPVHTSGSYHYRTFGQKIGGRTVGQAADISGARMADYARWALRTFGGQGAPRGRAPRRQNVPPPQLRPILLDPRLLTNRPTDVLQGLGPALTASQLPPLLLPSREETDSLTAELTDLRKRLLTA